MAAKTDPPAVFINCPFDLDYRPLLEATVFTVTRCGFAPRCALEIDDGTGTRIQKIIDLIDLCPFGIHDISRTELDAATNLPRFNMPFELGLFLGACAFENKQQRSKRCLILDKERYRYRNFLSDIAGQDIHAHARDPRLVIREVRNFLRANSGGRHLPSGTVIEGNFAQFKAAIPAICARLELDPDALSFVDFSYLVAYYLDHGT